MADKKIKIVYRDGTEEQVYVDDYYVRDGCFYKSEQYVEQIFHNYVEAV